MRLYRIKLVAVAACGLIAACDGDSNAQELRNRVLVASDNLNVAQITSNNNVIEATYSSALDFLAGDEVAEISYADNAQWISSNPSVATVDNTGLVTGVADGNVIISARLGPLSDSINLRVSSAPLDSIEITGPESLNECDSADFTATGLYPADADPSRIITGKVSWAVSATPAVGLFENINDGIFRSSAAGTALITATRGEVSQQFTLTVSDNLEALTLTPVDAVITTGGDTQYRARASYSDNEATPDVTNNVTWTVSNTTFATVDNLLPDKGSLAALNNGAVSLVATCGGQSASLDLTIGDPTVVDNISYQQSNPFELDYSGQSRTYQLVAQANLQTQETDIITSNVNWLVVSRSNNLLSVSNSSDSKGLLTVRGPGTITVEIEYTGDAYDLSQSVLNNPQLEIVVN